MIKINLLPKTINQKVILRNTALAFAGGLVAIIVGGVVFGLSLKAKADAELTEALRVEAQQARVQGLQSAAASVLGKVAALDAKLKFMDAVLKYNEEYPKLYADVAKWTYKNVQYTSMTSDGARVTMTATVKNLDDLGRYMLNMYQARNLFTQVSIDSVQGGGLAQGSAGGAPGMPGGPMYTPATPSGPGSMAGIGAITTGVERDPGRQGWIAFSVTCTLKQPIAGPSFSGTGWTPVGGQIGGPGAMPGVPQYPQGGPAGYPQGGPAGYPQGGPAGYPQGGPAPLPRSPAG